MLRVVHFEIHCDNPERAAAFYTQVFGWDIKKWDSPTMEYWMVMTGPKEDTSGISGGLMKRPAGSPVDGQAMNAFVCTVDVPSVDEYLQKIQSAGGSIAMPKFALPGMAWLAYAKDTEGNTFGIFQEDKNAA